MYRRKIEQFFFQTCQRGMMFSPKEWMLVDRWAAAGIPREVVEKGIKRTFERLDKPNQRVSLYLCDSEVQRLWQWHRQNRRGSQVVNPGAEADLREKAFVQEKISQIITRLEDESSVHYEEIYRRMIDSLAKILEEVTRVTKVDTLRVETAVEEIFSAGFEAIKAVIPKSTQRRIRAAVEADLRSAKTKMTPQAYRETVEAGLDDELRQQVGFEKLNLFSLKL